MVQIDVKKSTQKQRIVYKLTGELILNSILDNTLWIIWIAASILALTNRNNYHSNFSIIYSIIIISLDILLLIGIWLKNKMLKISFKDQQTNRKVIISILNQRFPKLRLYDSSSQLITFEREVGLFNWGKTIVIIFEGNNIYINWTTIGRNNIKSPFHAPFNYYKLIRIRDQIQKNTF